MHSFLIIGAGRFGKHLASNLCHEGHEVMLVDNNPENINEVWNEVTTAEIGDYTIKSNLEALGVEDYDHIFVCITDFRASLIIVDNLKELGARDIVAKAGSEVHERFLLKNGADRVIYPERKVAASTAVAYSINAIYDYLQLSDELGIYEIEPPHAWLGKTPAMLNIRQKHGVNIIAAKSGGRVVPVAADDYTFSPGEHILVMGSREDIKRLKK